MIQLFQKKNLALLALITFSIGLSACSSSSSNSNSNANYRITFTGTWTSATHSPLPNNPHFSPPVVVSHTASANTWAAGSIATQGVENVAETGNTSTLKDELATQQNNSTVGDVTAASSSISNDESISLLLEVTENFPYISFITMIAPSPDWLASRSHINLYPNNEWVTAATYDIFAYDAGTDSGKTFTAANADIPSQNPIARFTSANATSDAASFIDGNGNPIKVGTLTIERL